MADRLGRTPSERSFAHEAQVIPGLSRTVEESSQCNQIDGAR
jgi:hypothetical protein